MASKLPSTTLGIHMEVTAVLSTIDGSACGKPVWTLAKHRSGYSLKLFWGESPPNGAHSGPVKGNQNTCRLEEFC